MTGKRVIFVGTVHEAVPALGVLLDSEAEVAEVMTLPTERAASTSGFVDLEPLARANGIAVRRATGEASSADLPPNRSRSPER
jgi:methionyl-tRNA formyltransferase